MTSNEMITYAKARLNEAQATRNPKMDRGQMIDWLHYMTIWHVQTCAALVDKYIADT